MGVPARRRQSGPQAFLWANRPDASGVPARTKIWISDFGVGGGSEWYSDGAVWRPVSDRVVLPGTVTPVTFSAQSPSYKLSVAHSIAIPAGMVIPGCRLESFAKWETAANTDSKYFRFYLNAAASGPYLTNYNVNGGTAVVVQTAALIDFIDDTSQLGTATAMNDVAVAASAFWTGSVDTTQAFTFDAVASIASTSDAVTLKSLHGFLAFR